jgi:hypothetical protein
VADSKRAAAVGTTVPAPAAAPQAADTKKPRSRLLQEDVPGYSLDQALRVARAIAENYAYKPTRPMNVARAMGMSPTSGPFRMITGSSVAYGLTTGAAQAPEIGITPLGMRVVHPLSEGDDTAATREALLKPRIIGEFLRDYDGASIPVDAIAKNVLHQKGVPTERLDDVLALIIDGAKAVGFMTEDHGKRWVDLAGPVPPVNVVNPPMAETSTPISPTSTSRFLQGSAAAPVAVSVGPAIHINVEIHIAADASSETIEEIFKNMRRYVLSGDGKADDGQTAAE